MIRKREAAFTVGDEKQRFFISDSLGFPGFQRKHPRARSTPSGFAFKHARTTFSSTLFYSLFL
jgi:hypothetical protein